MSITNVMLESYLQIASARQGVISENIANSNTPGYQAKDIVLPSNFSDLVKASGTSTHLPLKMSSSSHLSGNKPVARFKTVLARSGTEMKPNGNNVSVVDQAKIASTNQLSYEQVLKAYEASNKLIPIALGKGGR